MFYIFTLIAYSYSYIIYVNETYQLPLTQLFGYLENPTYTIVDTNPYATIIPQYHLYTDTQKHNQNADVIISVKAQHQFGHWTNHFLFLENNKGTFNVHYSENPQEENVATPKFNEHLQVTNKNNMICFDAEQFDSTHYIVDCALQITDQPLQNELYVVAKDQSFQQYQVTNPLGYKTMRKRKITLLFQDEQYYLFQGSLLQSDSIIQIYKIITPAITFEEQSVEISTNSLKTLYKDQLEDNYKFYLIDYKLVYNQIFILDNLFVAAMSFDKYGDWSSTFFIKLYGNIIAFDYIYFVDDNGNKLSILVILKDTTFDLYLNSQGLTTYQLPQKISQNSQVKISDHYIIIEDENTVYQYSIYNKILINQKTLQQVNFYLINPIYPDLISISYNVTRRYYINDGYLQIKSGNTAVDKTSFNIQAVSKGETNTKEISLQILNQNDFNLYFNDKPQQVITDVLASVNYTQDVIQFMSGPNVQFQFENQGDDLDMEFETLEEMIITNWPKASDIHFQDMLQFNDTQVYVLFQLKNKEVQIYNCKQNSFSLIEQCTQFVNTSNFSSSFNILVDQLHFQWWIENEQAYVIFCDQESTAELWKINEQELIKIKKISYIGQTITQLLELDRIIYILIEKSKKIGIYKSIDGTHLDQIDEPTVKSLGMIKSWSPKRIFGNQKYNGHLLFISNSDNILITIYNNQLNMVECILNTDDVQLTMYKQSFFMIKQNSILEYSLEDLNNVYLIRQLQVYNHEFKTPLIITQSEDNGFLFILTKQQQILVYQPFTQNSNDQLFRIIDVHLDDKFMMSASGYQKTHLYFNNGTHHSYFAILKQSKLYIKSINLNTLDYYVNVTKTLTILNSQHSQKILETIFILNTKYPIALNQQKDISINSSLQNTTVKFDQLYKGQVQNISIDCEQCKDLIQLNLPIQKINENMATNILDIESFNSFYNIALTKDKLLSISYKDNLSNLIEFQSPNNCELIAIQEDAKYIVTLCKYNNVYHAYLTVCDKEQKCTNIDTPQDILDLNGVQKMVVIPNNLLLMQDFGKIYVYYLNINPELTKWSISLTQIIYNDKGLTDFVIQKYGIPKEGENQNYILSFIDQADHLNVYYTEFKQNKLNIIQQNNIYLYDLIKKNNQYAFKTTDYIQLFATQEIQNNQLHYIIISNDVASFKLQLDLDNNKLVVNSKLINIFNPYQNWIAMNKGYFNYDNLLIIPYTNKQDIVLAIYELNDKDFSSNMVYGLQDSAFQVKDGLFIVYAFNEGQNKRLYTNLIGKVLNSYQISLETSLTILNPSKLKDKQQARIMASNAYNKEEVKFNIIRVDDPIPPPKPPNDDESSSSNWWWILLIVIFGGGLIVGGVIFYMKRKQVGLFRVQENQYSLHNY
ncbi:unnamed protein product [Paramecium pentaurelia]|uniref:Transmembrane protein n=1 Tax=Paramecium pentaurelia TaxID=43138 RepID=A0A8S1WH33_9CILI|nr:unnamed protein product [Paramecium pentaurelia]